MRSKLKSAVSRTANGYLRLPKLDLLYRLICFVDFFCQTSIKCGRFFLFRAFSNTVTPCSFNPISPLVATSPTAFIPKLHILLAVCIYQFRMTFGKDGIYFRVMKRLFTVHCVGRTEFLTFWRRNYFYFYFSTPCI